MNNNIKIISKIINEYLKENKIDLKILNNIVIDKPKNKNHGHISTNLAFVICKILKQKPNMIANNFSEYVKNNFSKYFLRIEPISGFVNFDIKNDYAIIAIDDVLRLKDDYGKSNKKNILYEIEYVSANPTGYLHLGHTRNGCIADSMAKIFKFAGYNVYKEYYTNDAGNQINNLAVTIYYYYLVICGKKNIEFPKECYQGQIYEDYANELYKKYGNKFSNSRIVDNKIEDSKINDFFSSNGIKHFMKIIMDQLKEIDIEFDNIIYESDFYKNGKIDETIKILKDNNNAYEKDGALWINSKKYGDDKDRVIIKSDGSYTYLLPDLANHHDKIIRTKADKLINYWGADHHSYVKRMIISLSLLGHPKDILDVEIIQMVRVVKNNKEVKMSKRKNTAIWLRDLIDRFGKSVIRYTMSSQSQTVHVNFDLEKLSKNNENNPVFYIQYATARCSNVLKKAKEFYKKPKDYKLLIDKKELELLVEIDLLNKLIEDSSRNRAVNLVCDYTKSLAKIFHSYYNKVRIIDLKNIELSNQRIDLVRSIDQVFRNLFKLIGIDYKEKMY